MLYDGPKLPGSAHVAFWSLYRALTEVGCPPPVAKRMTVFESACALGVGRKVSAAAPKPSGPPPPGGGVPQTPPDHLATIRARIEAAQRGETLDAEAVAKATTEDEIGVMMGAFAMPTT